MQDVVVIGAGVIGLAVAAELAARGASVQVFERDLAGHGASWAAGGMLAPFTEELPPGPLRELALRSLEMYPGYARELHEAGGVDIQLQRNGILELGFTVERLAHLRARVAALTAEGIQARMLSRDELFEREGALSARALGAVFTPGEGQVENRRLARALIATARARGVRLREQLPVQAVESNARRVLGVRTAEGFFAAGAVVNATGAWAGELAGVPEAVQARVKPVKGQMLALAMPREFLRHVVWAPGAYLIPRRDGRLVVGATVEDAGFDRRVTAGGVAQLLQAALAAVPGAATFALSETWSGHRPATRDGEPLIGATALEGYYLASGHYRNGILLAPVTGKIMADLVTANANPAACRLSKISTNPYVSP